MGEEITFGGRQIRHGVAIADDPLGPYIKSPYNPISNSGHEICVWPYQGGIASLITTDGPEKNTIQWAADGINFERINGDDDSVILRYDPAESLGNGHTGYFRWSSNPYSGINKKYIGYSLHGGGDHYYSALWGSDDAINWEKLHVLEPIEGQSVEDDRMIIWHELDPNSINELPDGGYVAICGVGNRASGNAARFVELYEVYLAADGVTITHFSQNILARGSSEDNDSEELASPTSINIDGKVHLLYVGAKEGGTTNTVMSAVGELDLTSVRSNELISKDQIRHIL